MTNDTHGERKLTVLFIDDELGGGSSAANYVAQLKEADFTVRAYTDLLKALEHVHGVAKKDESPEDVIVLDMMMPVTDEVKAKYEGVQQLTAGLYILKNHLRRRILVKHYLNVPVLILTNRDEHEVRILVEGLGRVWVRHKQNLPSFELAEKLGDIVHESDEMP